MINQNFPIMLPDGWQRTKKEYRTSIPWAMIAEHEHQAKENHDQSLRMLASRGGLSPQEAVAVLWDRNWKFTRDVDDDTAYLLLEELVTKWEAEHREDSSSDESSVD